ncbi:MAG: extracellular solute-binding protein [Dehalococcoidia bacterium]|nr:extracellular solute-binding protein [Dehalococcoidia bacterium]
MLKTRIEIGIVAVLGMVALLVACAPAAAPTATPAPKAAATAPSAPATAAAPAAAPSAAAATPSKPSALEQLIEGARKEGLIKASLPSTLDEKDAQRLVQAMNAKYNLDLKLEFTPNAKMTGTAAQLMTELKTGGTPSWDVVVGTPRHFVEMARQGLLSTYDWTANFSYIPKEAVLLNGSYVGFAGEFYVPVYNTNLVKPEDAPKKWEDLIDPKWKGKIVAHNSASVWVQLTEFWGEARVTSLVDGLARQQPTFVNLPQVTARIGSGEYPLGSNADPGDVFVNQGRGAPIGFANDVKPVIAEFFGLVAPQRAQHPSAAALFIAFQLTPEAQKIWWEGSKWGAPFLPGPISDWLKGKELAYVTVDFLQKDGQRLEDKYLKTLGLK